MKARRNSWANRARKRILIEARQKIEGRLRQAEDEADMYGGILAYNQDEYEEYIGEHPEITAFLDKPTLFAWYAMRDLEIPVDEDRAMGLTFKGEIEGNQRMAEGKAPAREEVMERLENHFMLVQRRGEYAESEEQVTQLRKALAKIKRDIAKL